MSATDQQTHDDPHRTFETVLTGSKSSDNARAAYQALRDGWDLPETVIGDGRKGIPVTRFAKELYRSHKEHAADPETPTLAEKLYGTRHPFLAAMLVGPEYEKGGGVRDVDKIIDHTRDAKPGGERALVDDGIVKSASPVMVDPAIVDIQRSSAPVLDIIPTVSQPGFTADYNVFSGRTLNDFFVTESDAADLSDNTGSEFALTNDTQDMKIMATLLNVSDFSQRAEETLDYMNLMDTTVGQVMQEIFIVKAKVWFYGDPDGGGSGEHENTNGYDGLASFAATGSNVKDETGTTSGRLEALLDQITSATQESGLTFGNARSLCSPAWYNAVYDEVTPVVRIDGYDADVEFGPQGLALGHERGSVPISPCDNIRDYSGGTSNGVGSNSTDGDVFFYDQNAIQFRALAPMSTVPLGRLGLADRAAIFEYGALIDKSQGNHTYRLRFGDV